MVSLANSVSSSMWTLFPLPARIIELIDCCFSVLLSSINWMQSHCCEKKEIFGHEKLKNKINPCMLAIEWKKFHEFFYAFWIFWKNTVTMYDVCKAIIWKICHLYSSCYAQRSCLQFINERQVGCLFMINGRCHIHKNVFLFHLNATILSHLDLAIVTELKRHQRDLKRDASNTDAMKQ